MVLGKDSHPSPQRPRHGPKPEPTSPTQGFTMSSHGLRLGLAHEPVGFRQGHTLEPAGSQARSHIRA